jgi:hypothetical protein
MIGFATYDAAKGDEAVKPLAAANGEADGLRQFV